MKTKPMGLIPLIALILSLVTVGQAQAKEILKVTILGPGLNGEIELTDTASLQVIRELGFTDEIYQPASVETGPYFEIHVSLGDGTEVVATSIYHYYPGSTKHPSYIYYAGGLNAWSSRDGQYFLLPADTDWKLHDLLANLGASLPDAKIQPTSVAAPPFPLLWVIGGNCLCVAIGIAIRINRSAANANR